MSSLDLISYLKTLKPEDWTKKVTDKWAVKDVIAHMVGWERESVKVLQEFKKNRKGNPWFLKTDTDYEPFNKKSIDFYKSYPPERLLSEWEKLRKEVERYIQEIGEEQLRVRPDMQWVFDEEIGDHHKHHYRQIKNAIER